MLRDKLRRFLLPRGPRLPVVSYAIWLVAILTLVWLFFRHLGY